VKVRGRTAPSTVSRFDNSAFMCLVGLLSVKGSVRVFMCRGDYPGAECRKRWAWFAGRVCNVFYKQMDRFANEETAMNVFDVSELPERPGDVRVPEGVTRVVRSDRESRHEFQSLHIPASVREIGDNAFYQIPITGQLTFAPASQLRRVGNSAFRYTIQNQMAIVFPVTLHEFGDSSFFACEFTSIEIPNTRARIGERAFGMNMELVNLTFTDTPGVTNNDYDRRIGRAAFGNSRQLRRIDATGVKVVDDLAFDQRIIGDVVIELAKFVHCVYFGQLVFGGKTLNRLELGGRDITFDRRGGTFSEMRIVDRVLYNKLYSDDTGY